MLVTISGLPGAGTSTVAKAVADALSVERLDGGSVFRAMAAERGMDLISFGALAERDPAIDLDLDTRLAARARAGDVVLESRLAGWIAQNERLDAVTVWIGCDEDERARRVAARDACDETTARSHNASREASEHQRYAGYYAIDLADTTIYDLLLDSTGAAPAALVDEIVRTARTRFTPNDTN